MDEKTKAAFEEMFGAIEFDPPGPDSEQKVRVNGEEMTMAEFVRRYEKGGIYSTQWDHHWMPSEAE